MEQIWRKTTLTAVIFFLCYLVVQYIVIKELQFVTALVAAIAFWLVYFIMSTAFAKEL